MLQIHCTINIFGIYTNKDEISSFHVYYRFRRKNDSIQAELQLTLNIYPAPESVFQLYIYRRRTVEICRGHNSFESSGIYFIVHFWNINLISCRTFYFILFYFQALQSRTNAGYFLRIFGIFQILSLFQFSQIKRVFSHEDQN